MPIGIYLHVPFCLSKCPYCDFYSVPLPDAQTLDRYTERLVEDMRRYRGTKADTLYFGGGTPSLLGGKRIARLIEGAADCFGLHGAEITLEANPADNLDDTFRAFAQAGGNRLSIGMQCGDDAGLKALGRRHTADDFLRCVQSARNAGIDNISADWMLALPHEDAAPRQSSLALLKKADVRHVSAYLLKIEPNTPFHRLQGSLALPDEDGTAEQYLRVCNALGQAGFAQYEISNFAKAGFQSRHNLKYWNAEPYLGFGPSAHSFFEGRRFAYPRSLADFLNGAEPTVGPRDADIPDASPAEYLMLRLRLTEGVVASDFSARFGTPLPAEWLQRAKRIPPQLLQCDEDGLRLTRRGFLLSNEILRRLLDL